MPDFFRAKDELTIAEIVTLTHAQAAAGGSLDRRIGNIAPLDTAGPSDLSFLDKSKFADQLATTRAGACLVSPRFATATAAAGLILLVTPEPYRAFVAVARALFPAALRPASVFGTEGRAASAHIHSSARLEPNVTVDPLAVIGPDAEIGSGTLVAAGAVVGPGARIGRDCSIGPGASILHALIGDRVIVHPGVRIGQDGFGYLPTPQGHQKIPQTRRVIIQDDVEIGANTTIDRGSTRDTVIGEGTKIDNLVQIAHNVSIGRHCVIASQTGISGSTNIGDYVMMGGQVGVIDHVSIGDGAMIGARGGIMENVPPAGRWAGYPAQPVREWLRGIVALRRFARGGDVGGED